MTIPSSAPKAWISNGMRSTHMKVGGSTRENGDSAAGCAWPWAATCAAWRSPAVPRRLPLPRNPTPRRAPPAARRAAGTHRGRAVGGEGAEQGGGQRALLPHPRPAARGHRRGDRLRRPGAHHRLPDHRGRDGGAVHRRRPRLPGHRGRLRQRHRLRPAARRCARCRSSRSSSGSPRRSPSASWC